MALTFDDRAIRRLTADEAMGMVEAGILPDAKRLELLDGLLTEKPVKSEAHMAVLGRLMRWLFPLDLAGRFTVRTEGPLGVPDSIWLPEPDLAVLERQEAPLKTYPTTALFVIEVAVTSHGMDLKRKPPHYAAAGVQEYWVVDVPGHRVERFRQPRDNAFGLRTTHAPPETLRPASLDAEPLDLAELLAGV